MQLSRLQLALHNLPHSRLHAEPAMMAPERC